MPLVGLQALTLGAAEPEAVIVVTVLVLLLPVFGSAVSLLTDAVFVTAPGVALEATVATTVRVVLAPLLRAPTRQVTVGEPEHEGDEPVGLIEGHPCRQGVSHHHVTGGIRSVILRA